jgi:hypothetical protein
MPMPCEYMYLGTLYIYTEFWNNHTFNNNKPEGIKDRVMEGSEVMRMIFVCRCSDV